MYDAVMRHILTGTPAVDPGDITAAVVAFRALVPEIPALTPSERALLADWLDRGLKGG